jgi:HEPN domain-containing protein
MRRQTRLWVRKADADFAGARELAARRPPLRDLACFHAEPFAEKYLKAMLQELGLAVPRTHNLNDLLNLLLPHDATLSTLRRSLQALTRYAVDFRYPEAKATTRTMNAALRQAERVRTELRARLGLQKP